MSDTTDMMATVKRERMTAALVRGLTVDGLVEWIHALQDHGEVMEAARDRAWSDGYLAGATAARAALAYRFGVNP